MTYSEFLQRQKGCHLCNVDEGEIIAETDYFVIVPAIAPYTENHLLVISKRHIVSTLEMTKEEAHDLRKALDNCSRMCYHMGYEELSMFVRDGIANTERSGTGKSVSHMHYHVLPNANVSCFAQSDDRTRTFFSPEELHSLAQKLQKFWKESVQK